MLNKKKIFILLLVISLMFNVFLTIKITRTNITGHSVKDYNLLSPLEEPAIDLNAQQGLIHYQYLRIPLEEEIAKYNATGKVGVFIQDVKTGAWLGINEKEEFLPASLLKIPIMMAILKKVEREEITLKDKIILLEEDIATTHRYGSLYELGAGAEVTLAKLLTKMVTYSDNVALEALKRQLSFEEVNSVFFHVGIPNPYLPENNPTISPKNYIRIFRALYHSTFLSSELSQKALDLTTETYEESLLPKKIPPEIQVAHKFGVFELSTSNEKALHDCGIIYHQKNPYFLCIMTKDMELNKSSELIPELSRIIFEFVDVR